MEAVNRRGFFRQAGLGVAAVAAVTAAPTLLGTSPTTTGAAAEADVQPAVLEGPVVAYLRNAHTGEFSLLVGEREVRYTNKAMAAQLTRAAR